MKQATYLIGRAQRRKASYLAGKMVWGILLLICGCPTGALSGTAPAEAPSAMDVIPLFTAANVPVVGPEEIPIDPPNWTVSPDEGAGPPGRGLAQHAMLYI